MRNDQSEVPDGKPRNLARNTALTATVLLAPGGFILGGLLLARAIQKRRAIKAVQGGNDVTPPSSDE